MTSAIDLNADVGEEIGDDSAILALVDRANIACGYHAGAPNVMADTVMIATHHEVLVGAHVSYLDREGFGRRRIEVDPQVLAAQLEHQVEALSEIAIAGGSAVSYLKAHGALYNDSAIDEVLASTVVEVATRFELAVLTLPGSAVATLADRRGVAVVREGFPDRAYRVDGSLAPRSMHGAVIDDPDEVARRAFSMATSGLIDTIDGRALTIEIDTLCVHGDNPHSVACARAARSALERIRAR